MSSTEGMAFYHSPPLKIAVSALQREKHFRVNENLCEEVGIFRRLGCKAILGKGL